MTFCRVRPLFAGPCERPPAALPVRRVSRSNPRRRHNRSAAESAAGGDALHDAEARERMLQAAFAEIAQASPSVCAKSPRTPSFSSGSPRGAAIRRSSDQPWRQGARDAAASRARAAKGEGVGRAISAAIHDDAAAARAAASSTSQATPTNTHSAIKAQRMRRGKTITSRFRAARGSERVAEESILSPWRRRRACHTCGRGARFQRRARKLFGDDLGPYGTSLDKGVELDAQHCARSTLSQ